MNKSIEVQAKTIDQAIEQALAQLGASYDEVDVEVLSEGGFLRKAKVQVTLKSTGSEEIVSKSENKKEEEKVEKVVSKSEIKAETKVDVKGKEQKTEFKTARDIVKKEIKLADGEMPMKFQKTLEFTVKFLDLLGSGATATSEITERTFNININGDNVGMIIGKGGEVMNAIQTLVSSIAIANSNGEQRRVYVNVEDYKERRIETLKALALKKAEKVKETGRFIKLEPMNARDRAIIHSALQEVEGIRTYSTGKDPHRCLCVAPKRDEQESS